MSVRQFFSNLFSGNQGKGLHGAYVSSNDLDILPAFPKGIKNKNADALIIDYSAFIGQILIARGLIGEHNKDKAELLVHGPIRNYSCIVHYLPATQDEYYSAEGGLFRFGLECAFHSYRSSCAKIMNSNLVEKRIDSDMRWNHAAFLSGLYSEAIKTLSRINIYSIDGTPWHQGHEIFMEWMKQGNVASYQISWRQEPNEELAATVAARIIGQGIFGYLAAGEKNIITTFCDSLMNPNNMQNPLTGIVRSVRHKLINKDIEQNAAKYGVKRYGMHLEPWLIDTFRYLYNTRKWTVNEGRSALWYGRDGVFLTWPGSFGSLVEAFRETNVPFIPHGAAGLINVLHDSRIITGDGNELIYRIRIKGEGKERMNTAIRLANPDIVFYGKDYPRQLDYILEYGLEDGNPLPSDYVGEYDGGRGDAGIRKGVSTHAIPNALTMDGVMPNSGSASIHSGRKNPSKNKRAGGFPSQNTEPGKEINLVDVFSAGAGAGRLTEVDEYCPVAKPRPDPKTHNGMPDNKPVSIEPFKVKPVSGIKAPSPELSGFDENELNNIADFMAILNNGRNIGDEASPTKKQNAQDASGSDKSGCLSSAMALLEELDNHSFNEKADVDVSDMESPGYNGCAAVSGNGSGPSDGSLTINNPNTGDALEPLVPVLAVDVKDDIDRSRQGKEGFSERSKVTLDIAKLFEDKG